jgi:hypothetical protein
MPQAALANAASGEYPRPRTEKQSPKGRLTQGKEGMKMRALLWAL